MPGCARSCQRLQPVPRELLLFHPNIIAVVDRCRHHAFHHLPCASKGAGQLEDLRLEEKKKASLLAASS